MNEKASNPYEFIEDEGVVRWLSLCGYDTERMSDFEKLSAYMECVSLMPDNALRKDFFEKAGRLLGAPFNSKMTATEFWQRGNRYLLESCGLVVEDCSEICGKTVDFSTKTGSVAEIPTKRIFNLDFFVDSIVDKKQKSSFEEFTGSLLSELKQEKAPYRLALNIENIDFCRGDHYHAKLAYEKLMKNEPLCKGELEGYRFWLLSYLLEQLLGKCVLYLNIGSNIPCAEALISYLEMRKLLPRTHIAVTDETRPLVKELCDLCLMSKKGKITLDFVLGSEDSPSVIKSRLEELLAVYPTQMLRFGGICSDSRLICTTQQYAKKAITHALSELVADTERAIKIIENIFGLSE